MKNISRLSQLLFILCLTVPLLSPSLVSAEHKLKVFTTGELGMLVPASHTIQFDKAGTVFNYIEDGGQDNAFVFARVQAEIRAKKNTL